MAEFSMATIRPAEMGRYEARHHAGSLPRSGTCFELLIHVRARLICRWRAVLSMLKSRECSVQKVNEWVKGSSAPS
jgi:hypothetical protein